MEKIVYCQAKSIKPSKKLPFSHFPTKSIQQARRKDCPIVVFDYKFIKRRKRVNLAFIKDKISLLCFSSKEEVNLSEIKKMGFFDYFSFDNTRQEILFKIKKAKEVVKLKNSKENFKNKNNFFIKPVLTDSLTGCHNWRYFLEEARRQLVWSKRYSEKVSFVGIDIDRFRQINEIYGVKVADRVIKGMVKLLEKNLRKEDVLCRWREDEFFIIAPYLGKENVLKTAFRIKEIVDKHKFKHKSVSLRVRVSIGTISSPEDSIFSPKDAAIALDRVVAQAKRQGGNVVAASSWPQGKPLAKGTGQVNVEEMRRKVEKLNFLLNNDILDVIYGFARAIEAKDAYTGSHIEYTAEIAKSVARALKLPASEIKDIEHAAVLHDLGKVGISEKILAKKGPLTPSEKEVIKTHSSIASEILKDIHGLRGAVQGVLYHHECFDGSGYPLGLKGDEIPLSARIVAVADVYQALISERPYRKAYSKNRAIEIIKKESGSHFDPKIVKIFLKVIQGIS